MSLLQVRDLHKAYGTRKLFALDELTLVRGCS